MINKELFDDHKDAEIARLKMAIKKFKEYDRQRTAYYADKLARLKELAEMCGKDTVQVMDTLKGEIKRLNYLLQVKHIEDNRTPEELRQIIKLDNILSQNEQLKQENKKLHGQISDLVARLTTINNK